MTEKRLTKKESLILLSIGIMTIAVTDGILSVFGGGVTFFSIFSLLSKNGLRVK